MFDFKLNSKYSFNTLVPGYLGAYYEGAEVEGILSFDEAIKKEDVYTLHKAIYPELPTGTPIDPKDLNYILFKLQNGDYKVLAYEWLETNSIVNVDNITMQVVIYNTTSDKVVELRELLTLNGFAQFTIDIIT